MLGGAAARTPQAHRATGHIAVGSWPYLPGSVIPLRINGFARPYRVAVVGTGRVSADGLYEIPQDGRPGTDLVVAGNAAGLATARVRIGVPPASSRALLVVASYDDGLIFHDAANFSVLGVLATGGTPGDVAIDPLGRIATPDTEGTRLTLATLRPWSVSHVDDVVLGDGVAFDRTTQAIFVTNRDLNGNGALTRVDSHGSVARVVTGATAEGLAVDEDRQLVYVANTNDGTITVVDSGSMRVVQRFHAVDRIFSLALSADGSRLYGISNQSAGSPFAAAGSAIAISLRGQPRVVARSENLTFPLGVALDSKTQTLFVSDEALGEIYVLDAQTLRPKRAALRTCAIPWQPSLDSVSERLYVPCAGANEVDAFDARSLQRIHGAPFPTGSYPLAVAAWHPSERTSLRPHA